VSLPKALVRHNSQGRIRIKVPDKRGDIQYFTSLAENLSMQDGVDLLEVNPLTSGVLVMGEGLSEQALAEWGEKAGMFALETTLLPAHSPAQAAVEPIRRVNQKLRSFSGGDLDLATVGFLALLGTGVYQLLRGNFRSPPWYTAFWYAFGVFSKALFSNNKEKTE
jgi:hypothetical protein